MSADPVEDIADAMVEFFRGAPNWDEPPSIVFDVEKDATPDANLEKEKLRKSKLFVVPYGETAEKIGRGGQALEVYQVFVIFARAMDNDFTRPKLANWAREMKLALRKAVRMAGYVWTGDDTTVKLNTPLARENDVFVSGCLVSFAGVR